MNQAQKYTTEVLINEFREALKVATPGNWTKGLTTHHTVSEQGGEKQTYRIAEFHHANDAAFCDLAHNHVEQVLDALETANARADLQRAELVAEAARTAEEKLRADQMTEQHRMQCNMRKEIEEENQQLRGQYDAAASVVAELKAQLSAIGAGGVEALRKPAQAVPTDERQRMTAGRASFFMERFLKEEKLLGPNEQAALHFVIDMLAAPAQTQDDLAAFKAYLQECDDCAIVPDVAGAFNAGWTAATRDPAQEHATQLAGQGQAHRSPINEGADRAV